MSAEKRLVFEHGATFKKTFTLLDANRVPVSLSEYVEAYMDIKPLTPNSAVVFTLSTINGRIDLSDTANGVITLNVTKEDVITIPYDLGTLEYDLFLITASGFSLKFLRGMVDVEKKVTNLP